MLKRKFLSLAVLSLAATGAWAITQSGDVGATSTGYIDGSLEISRVVQISGLQDISFTIDPTQQSAPLKSSTVTICLYSSTSRASVTADTNTTVDRASHTATLESDYGSTPFGLTIDNVDVFTAVSPVFDSSVSTTNCSDSQGRHNVVVTLPEIPTHAGTYQATVTLTVVSSDM